MTRKKLGVPRYPKKGEVPSKAEIARIVADKSNSILAKDVVKRSDGVYTSAWADGEKYREHTVMSVYEIGKVTVSPTAKGMYCRPAHHAHGTTANNPGTTCQLLVLPIGDPLGRWNHDQPRHPAVYVIGEK